MIDHSEIHKRILATKHDIFPLGKMLPLATVYRFFKDEYGEKSDKTSFITNRKYQRLREGYFSLFVGVSLSKNTHKEHYICFPETDDRDIDFLFFLDNRGARPEYGKLICDVKEFTDYSESFDAFLENAIEPRVKSGSYHLIIGLHTYIDLRKSLDYLINLSSPKSTIWIVSSCSFNDLDYNSGIVTMIQGKDRRIIQDEIDLTRDIPILDRIPIIYQDILRDKLS